MKYLLQKLLLGSILISSCATTEAPIPKDSGLYKEGDCVWYKVTFDDGSSSGPILRVFNADNYGYILCSNLPHTDEYKITRLGRLDLEAQYEDTKDLDYFEILPSSSVQCMQVCSLLFRKNR